MKSSLMVWNFPSVPSIHLCAYILLTFIHSPVKEVLYKTEAKELYLPLRS